MAEQGLLLDSHALIWHLSGSSELSSVAAAAIQDPSRAAHVSVGTLWELAIKASLGRLTLGRPFDEFVAAIPSAGMLWLAIAPAHAAAVAVLPHHHGDPFDRLLIAQALAEGLTLVSNDTAFDRYGVRRIW